MDKKNNVKKIEEIGGLRRFWSLYSLEFSLGFLLVLKIILFMAFFMPFYNNIFYHLIYILTNMLFIILIGSQIKIYKVKKLRKNIALLLFLSYTLTNFHAYYLTVTSSYTNHNILDYLICLITFVSGILIICGILLHSSVVKSKRKSKAIGIKEALKEGIAVYIYKINFSFASVILGFISLIIIGATIFISNTGIFTGAVTPENTSIWSLWSWGSFLRFLIAIGAFIAVFLVVEWRFDLFFDFDDKYWGYQRGF